MKYYIIVYKNTHDAMEAEKNLNANGIIFRVMPTPTSITHSCGMCTRIEDNDVLNEVIERKLVNYKNIYLRSEEGFSVIE